MQSHRVRFLIAAAVLLAIEICIGCFVHHSWVRSYLGDVLVIVLLYCLYRTVLPDTPKPSWLLPTLLLLFCYGVEGLQAWHLVDRLHITNAFLRILIGTSFSWVDMLSYTIGAIPVFAVEWLRGRKR